MMAVHFHEVGMSKALEIATGICSLKEKKC